MNQIYVSFCDYVEAFIYERWKSIMPVIQQRGPKHQVIKEGPFLLDLN